MDVVIDIETIPDQSENAIDRFMSDDVKVTCPHKSKKAIGEDLGMSESEYKFIGAEDFKQMWIDKKGKDAKLAQANEKWLKTSFDGAYGSICAICYDAGDGVKTFSSLTSSSEKEILSEFWMRLKADTNGREVDFVAHNAKFDLPFLFHRSVIHKVKPLRSFKPYGRHGQHYFCTMEAWAGFGGNIGLDRLAGILGLGSKTEGMSGDQVWPEYQKGNIGKIAEYCAQDASLCKAVYERLTFGGA